MPETSQKHIVLAFDLFGTLLDTASTATLLEPYVGLEQAQAISTTWRQLQTQFNWRLNSMGKV